MWSANEPSEVGSNSFGEEQGQYYRLEKRTLHSYPEEELSSHMEEYSFNQLQRHRINNKREQDTLQGARRDRSEGEDVAKNISEKYRSLFAELKGLDISEILELFFEEVEENERTSEEVLISKRKVSYVEEQIAQLKMILEQKREAIAVLCMTETNNLNLIEEMQTQLSKSLSHLPRLSSEENIYYRKYTQLEKYMHEYINSTNEAQEQFTRKYGLVMSENSRLTNQLNKLNSDLVEAGKVVALQGKKLLKQQRALQWQQQKEATMRISRDNMKEENDMLKKELESLQAEIRASNLFEAELARENKELSSELDFIKDKINENQSISRDIFEKLEENSENYTKLQKENSTLQEQLRKLYDELQSSNEENQRLVDEISGLNQQNEVMLMKVKELEEALEEQRIQIVQLREQKSELQKSEIVLINENSSLQNKIDQQAQQMREMQARIKSTDQAQQQLLQQYTKQRENKDSVKQQLIELAEQVRYMQLTYKKELLQGEKIRVQLQKFWQKKERKQEVMSEIVNQNASSQVESHAVLQSKDSRSSVTHSTERNSNIGKRQRGNKERKQNQSI